MSIVLESVLILRLAVGWIPPLEPSGQFDRQSIPESSGIVKSRKYPGIYWVHNDSGNPPLLFAIRGDGTIVARFSVEAANLDWEDIASDDLGRLYLGDIGNNTHALPIRTIYRIDEPDPAAVPHRPLRPSASISYALPRSNRFDAEGLFVDGDSAVVVTKYRGGREAELYAIPLTPPAPLLRPAEPRLLGRLPGFVEPATGAALSRDRRRLAVCSGTVTRVYDRSSTEAPWRMIAEVAYPSSSIEGVTWDDDDLVLVAEGVGTFRISQSSWKAATPKSAGASLGPASPAEAK